MNRVFNELPKVFVFHTGISRVASWAVKAGRVPKLASRLCTRNLEDTPQDVVRRNLRGIVAGYFPGALVADRASLEAAPASDGSLYLVSDRGNTLRPLSHRPTVGGASPRGCRQAVVVEEK